jgi:hypothetical protein
MADAAAAVRAEQRRPAIREAIRRAQSAGLPLQVAALAGIRVRDDRRPGGQCWPVVVCLGDDLSLLLWQPGRDRWS